MTPEQIIQAAFVARSNRDRDERKAQGFFGPQATWPVWAPEVAIAALKGAGWNPPSCSCSPDPGVESGTAWEAGICGPARPLTPNEWAAFDHISDELKEMGELEKGMRNIADEGEWPEVAS